VRQNPKGGDPLRRCQGMKRTFGRVLSVLIFAISAVAVDPGLVLHKRVSEVRLSLVATDSTGRPWPDLSPSSLTISDGGQLVSDFQLRNAADTPLRIGILLDLSDSTQKSWSSVRASLIESMDGLVHPGDEILMMTFNSRIEMERVITGPEDLTEVVNSSSGGLTALYDSLYEACAHPVFSSGFEARRSALILFSDGEDSVSYRALADAIAAAVKTGVAIYTITTHRPERWQRGDAVLHLVASLTGGRDFVVKDLEELRTALQTINEELRNSYVLYYHVPSEETRRAFRRVEVFPVHTKGLRLRARAGYYTTP